MRRLLHSPMILAIAPAAAVTLSMKELFEVVSLEPGILLWSILSATMVLSYIVAVIILQFLQKVEPALPEQMMSADRQDAIHHAAKQVTRKMLELQKQFTKIQKSSEKDLTDLEKKRLLSRPAWSTVTSTTSLKGKRLIVGFRNRGCSYRRRHAPGCFVCGFNANTVQSLSPTKKDLGRQLRRAIGEATEDYDSLEFLGDGSFLRDEEVGDETKKVIFDRINTRSSITRVLVEARPGDIDREDIEILLCSLTRKQTVEIGIGLESASDFVRKHCVNKGFPLNEFVDCVDLIASDDRYRKRVRLVAYLLLKPPFLTEKESIVDVITSLGYLRDLAKTKGVKIIPKIEPAVVARGTALDILNQTGTYEPVSYWSVVEILMHAQKMGLAKDIRVGGRHDMYSAERLPAVYSREHQGMFHKYDFIIYGAVMAFNQHHSIPHLLADLNEAMKQECFILWEANLFAEDNGRSLCSSYAEKYARSVKARQRKQKYLEHTQRQSRIFKALDEIEYDNTEIRHMLSPAEAVSGECAEKLNCSDIEELMIDIFEAKNVTCDIRIINCYMQRNAMCRIYFKLTDMDDRNRVSEIWVGIPMRSNANVKTAAKTAKTKLSRA